MKRILYGLIIGLSILWAMSARAGCETQPSLELQRACEQGASYSVERERAFFAEQRERDRHAQSEAARQQALGLALFGSGPALIQGMNQGFRPLPPYQQPGAQR